VPYIHYPPQDDDFKKKADLLSSDLYGHLTFTVPAGKRIAVNFYTIHQKWFDKK
jgi:hypothetical protein